MDEFVKFTDRARKVLTIAQDESRRFNHNYIGSEHLLMALAREHEGLSAKVLNNLGVTPEKVVGAVEFIIGRGDRPIVGVIGLTPRAKRVIELSKDEARRFGHNYIGTEHLLLGLLREGEGIAAGVLEALGVNLDKARNETIRVLSNPPKQPILSDKPQIVVFKNQWGVHIDGTRGKGEVEIVYIDISPFEDMIPDRIEFEEVQDLIDKIEPGSVRDGIQKAWDVEGEALARMEEADREARERKQQERVIKIQQAKELLEGEGYVVEDALPDLK